MIQKRSKERKHRRKPKKKNKIYIQCIQKKIYRRRMNETDLNVSSGSQEDP